MCASLQPILALLGHPVAGNPTQFMMEKAFLHQELDWRYLSLDVPPEGLGDALRGMRAMGFHGGNLTGPHKEAAGPHLDCLGRTAELSGTINCIRREDQTLAGENTEGRALVEALRKRADPAGKRVALLGAGRMARAVAVELALAGVAEILVVNRSAPSGTRLVELLSTLSIPANLTVAPDPYPVPADIHVLIDATAPDPHHPDAPARLVLDQLASATIVADVAFDPPRRWLLAQAAERGCPTIDGLEVFVERTAIDFQLWTGLDPDRTILREAAEEFLEL